MNLFTPILLIFSVLNLLVRAGLQCDFESNCAWSFEPGSKDGGFRVVSGIDHKDSTGHFAYLGIDKQEEIMAKIVSPYYQYTGEHCKLKFHYRLHGMPKTELIVLLENLPDKILNTTPAPAQVKTFTPAHGSIATWREATVNIGQIRKPAKLRLEVWLNNFRKNLSIVEFTSDSYIDDIHLLDCEEELYHPDFCQSNRTEKYKCSLSKLCIEWDQLCDMTPDCYGGEDEDSSVHNCTQVPLGARCNFEDGTCGWRNTSLVKSFKWIRISGHERQNLEKIDQIDYAKDHTFQNSSGHFMYAERQRDGLIKKAYLTSPKFPAMARILRNESSVLSTQCKIRFFYHRFGSEFHSVTLYAFPTDGRKEQIIWDEGKNSHNKMENFQTFWHRVSVHLPYQDSDYTLQFTAVTLAIYNGNMGIDDFSMTPQCFIQDDSTETRVPYVYNFTNCGAEGSAGPSQAKCNLAYNGTALKVAMIPTAYIDSALEAHKILLQAWKIPKTGQYRIIASGAAGGRIKTAYSKNSKNFGAEADGLFDLVESDRLFVVVGQRGHSPCTTHEQDIYAGRYNKPQIHILSALCQKQDVDGIEANVTDFPGAAGGGATYVFKASKDQLDHGFQLLMVAAGGGGLFANSTENVKSGGNGPRAYSGYIFPKKNISSRYFDSGIPSTNDAKNLPYNLTAILQRLNGGQCDASSLWKFEGGFGGGSAACSSQGGGGGGFIAGETAPSLHGAGGWSFSVDGNVQFRQNFNKNDGKVLVYPCIKDCPSNSSCRFQKSKQICVCPDGLEISEAHKICIALFVPPQIDRMPPEWPSVFLSDSRFVALAACIGFLIMCLFFTIVCITFRYKRAKKRTDGIYKNGYNNGNSVMMRNFTGPLFHTELNPNYELFSGMECQNSQDLREIPRNCVTLIRALGQGAFGEVYEGILCNFSEESNGLPIAIKTLPEYATDQAQLDFHMEALIMSKFNHPNIVRFIGVCFEKMPRFIVLELLAGGDLKSFLRENRSRAGVSSHLIMYDLLHMALDVSQGCQYLEENHFIHRDIAARNCLLTMKSEGRIVKIADFGMARDIYRADYYRKGGKAMLPVKWMPPEAFLDGIFTAKTDVWSYGVLLWEIFSMGYMPYPGRGNQEVMQLVTAGGRLEQPIGCPVQIYQIMTQCWHTAAEDRPKFATIIERLGYCMQDPDIIHMGVPSSQRSNLAGSAMVSSFNGSLDASRSLSTSIAHAPEPMPTEGTGVLTDAFPPYRPQNADYFTPTTASTSARQSDTSASDGARDFLLTASRVGSSSGSSSGSKTGGGEQKKFDCGAGQNDRKFFGANLPPDVPDICIDDEDVFTPNSSHTSNTILPFCDSPIDSA